MMPAGRDNDTLATCRRPCPAPMRLSRLARNPGAQVDDRDRARRAVRPTAPSAPRRGQFLQLGSARNGPVERRLAALGAVTQPGARVRPAGTLSDDGARNRPCPAARRKRCPTAPWSRSKSVRTGYGVRSAAAVAHSRRTPEISATGDGPVAASAGGAGQGDRAVQRRLPPIDTIAHSTLTGTSTRFGRATDLPDHETINSPLLAANLASAFLTA